MCLVYCCCPFPLDHLQPLWPLQVVNKGRREGLEIPSWLQGEFPLFQARHPFSLGCGIGGILGSKIRSHLAAQSVGSGKWEGAEGDVFLPSWIHIFPQDPCYKLYLDFQGSPQNSVCLECNWRRNVFWLCYGSRKGIIFQTFPSWIGTFHSDEYTRRI